MTAALLTAALGMVAAQSNAPKEEFNAIAMVNNNIASGSGRVIMQVERWSTPSETNRLAATLTEKGPQALLSELIKTNPVGTIRTPDSLGYDLHYAFQQPGEEGGRQIVLATDRPISFWESVNQPRTIDYPFTVIQMQIDRNGNGKGTLSYATKITATKEGIELENFATSPVMLTQVNAEKRSH